MTRLTGRLSSALVGASFILVCAVQPGAADNTADTADGRTARNALRPAIVVDFKSRAAFDTDKEYGKYIETTLRIGYRVRAAADYQRVKKGMTGTYYGTNGGTPPCLVVWDDDIMSDLSLLPNVPPEKATHAYWVNWQDVEIVDIDRH